MALENTTVLSEELFYTLSFAVSLAVAIVGLIFCLSIAVIILISRECRTVNNLLVCDSCGSSLILFMTHIVGCVYGLQNEWQFNQILCLTRAYLIMLSMTSSCYSLLIQSISRLFFAVFYKHRYLLTWRTHWILVVIKWLVSSIISIEPFFITHGYGFVKEYRMCGPSTTVMSVMLYTVLVSFFLPSILIVIIYRVIIIEIRRSTRRIAPARPGEAPISNHKAHSASSRRDVKIIQKIILLLNLLALGGLPFLILLLWNLIQQRSVPIQLHSIAIDFSILAHTSMKIVVFLTNKPIKDVAFAYFSQHWLRLHLHLEGQFLQR